MSCEPDHLQHMCAVAESESAVNLAASFARNSVRENGAIPMGLNIVSTLAVGDEKELDQ